MEIKSTGWGSSVVWFGLNLAAVFCFIFIAFLAGSPLGLILGGREVPGTWHLGFWVSLLIIANGFLLVKVTRSLGSCAQMVRVFGAIVVIILLLSVIAALIASLAETATTPPPALIVSPIRGEPILIGCDLTGFSTSSFSDICVIGFDGNGRGRLTYSHRSYNPSLTPDGKQILFERGDDYYSVNPDGSGIRLFRENTDVVRFSPDMKNMVYVVDTNHKDQGMFLVDSKGETTKIGEGFISGSFRGSPDGGLKFSPDSSQISYVLQGRSFAERISDLHLVDVESKDDFIVPNVNNMDWSPDSQRTVLARENGVFIREIANGSQRQITSKPALWIWWSPDGEWIVYRSYERQMYRIRPDGSQETAFKGENYWVSWSRDATQVVVRGSGGTSVFNADWTGERVLKK